jgi:hypothetical protein
VIHTIVVGVACCMSMAAADLSDRTKLMAQHEEAKRRRDAAPLGSDEFREGSEEVARIEIAIAAQEELPPESAAAAAAGTQPASQDRGS